MKHVIYKITNTLNNKIYIGAHSTEDINDSYMGSGIAIKKAQKKSFMYLIPAKKCMRKKEKLLILNS